MADRAEIENEIRELLQSESHTVTLSNRLFAPSGLFSQLASNADERRAITRSLIWRDAQERLRELENRDAAALDEAMRHVQSHMPNGSFRLRFESMESQPTE